MRHTVLVIPAEAGVLRHVAGPAEVRGDRWAAQSLLESFPVCMDERRLILWSGSLAQIEGGGLFDEDPRTWGPKGWTAMHEVIAGWTGCSPDSRAIRTHARHVVSDIPGCRRLLESEPTISLCYDPASMMSPGMVGRAEDHLRRMYEAIELMPTERLAMVVVAGVDERGAPCGLHKGGELGALVARLAAEWVPVEVPVVVLEGGEEEQIRVLEAAGV